jgi:hypothetical protein
VDIEDSQRITLQGFTVNGGATGVFCGHHSFCHFKGNTIQGAVNGGGGDGSGVDVQETSQATFDGDVIQFNSGDGLDVADGSSDALVSGAKIQYNAGDGIFVGLNSTLRVNGTQIVGNSGGGVTIFNSSVVRFGAGRNPANGNTITNNAGPGVFVRDVSFALFGPSGNMVIANNTSTGGAGFDVDCEPKLSATRGATTNIGGGTTNCGAP